MKSQEKRPAPKAGGKKKEKAGPAPFTQNRKKDPDKPVFPLQSPDRKDQAGPPLQLPEQREGPDQPPPAKPKEKHFKPGGGSNPK